MHRLDARLDARFDASSRYIVSMLVSMLDLTIAAVTSETAITAVTIKSIVAGCAVDS